MSRLLMLARRRDSIAAFSIAAILIVAELPAFVPNLNAFFLSDDFVLLSWTHVGTPSAVAAFFDPHTEWFYRPMVKLVYWAGQGLFGLHAVPFHLFSLALHAANAYLVYRTVRQQGAWSARISEMVGMVAALLFLLDPHHAETVSWISAVGDLMGAFCMLLNLLLFRRYIEKGGPAKLVGALGLFAVGLLSRETVVLLPGLLLLQTLTGARGTKQRWRRLLPAFGWHVALLSIYLFVQNAGKAAGQTGMARGGLQFHPLNLDSVLLGILDYTHGLVPGGTLLLGASLDTLKLLIWVEWAALVALAAVLWRLKQQTALFGLAWLLFTPLVFVFFSPPTDRYFYLPSVGFAILFGSLLGGLLERAAKWNASGRRAASSTLTGAAALALALLLSARGADVTGKVLAWRAAGQVSGGVLHDIHQAAPNPHSYAGFYLTGLPVLQGGIPIFQNGLQEAVQLTYGDTTLAAHTTDCTTLQKATDLPRYTLFFQYKENGAQQFSSPQSCPP